MDERLDQQIVGLNERYQKLKGSKEYAALVRIQKYAGYLKSGSIHQMLREFQFSRFARRHQSLKGNINYADISSDINVSEKRIAVYTCIIGKYDNLIEPVVKEKNVDFLVFTDQQVAANSVWIKKDVTKFRIYDRYAASKLNRAIKMRPYLFLDYDYSIYIDGNIEVVGAVTPMVKAMGNRAIGLHFHGARDCIYDEIYGIQHLNKADMSVVKKQISAYRKERFPKHFGLYENSIILRNHHHLHMRNLMEVWWQEYVKYPTRDQLSLPYAMWKSSFDKSQVYILGNHLDYNPRFNRENKHLK